MRSRGGVALRQGASEGRGQGGAWTRGCSSRGIEGNESLGSEHYRHSQGLKYMDAGSVYGRDRQGKVGGEVLGRGKKGESSRKLL